MQSSDIQTTLKDGTPCTLRLCCHTNGGHDRESLREGIRSAWCQLSPESRYSRFGYAPNQLSDVQLDYLADLDNRDRLAVCAFVQNDTQSTGIGLARFMRIKGETDVAEFAVTVVDEYQHSGLGSLLLARLLELAAEADMKVLRGYIRPSNRAMLALAKKFGGTTGMEDDYLLIDIPVTPARKHTPVVDRIAGD